MTRIGAMNLMLHGIDNEESLPFYLASTGTNLIAYIQKERTWGFCRDLFFDHLRCQHKKGNLICRQRRILKAMTS